MAEPLPLVPPERRAHPRSPRHASRPFDRSFLFGDGVYEVLREYDGKLFRPESHFNRLDHSTSALRMTNPHTHGEWQALLTELVRANGGGDQYVYLQVFARRRMGPQPCAAADIPPTIFAYCTPWPQVAESTLRDGLACITAEDTRWARRDIKSVALLANVLLRQLAVDANASETILLSAGELLEGRRFHRARGEGWRAGYAAQFHAHPARHHAQRGGGACGLAGYSPSR